MTTQMAAVLELEATGTVNMCHLQPRAARLEKEEDLPEKELRGDLPGKELRAGLPVVYREGGGLSFGLGL